MGDSFLGKKGDVSNIFFNFFISPDYPDYPDYEKRERSRSMVVAAIQARGAAMVPSDCAQNNSGPVARVLSDLADRQVGKPLISIYTQHNRVGSIDPLHPDYTRLCDFLVETYRFGCVSFCMDYGDQPNETLYR